MPVSYNNTSRLHGEGGGVSSCIFQVSVVGCCRPGLVTQEAGSLQKLLDFFLLLSKLCLKTNLICVKAGAYASGYRIPHLSSLCCLACTMLRILIQLWGLCIFLYCYYGHDNNDITDILVFSLIKTNKKKRGQNTRMLVKNWFVLIVFKRSTFPKWFFTHSVLFFLVNIKDMVLRALNLYVMIKFYFISHFCLCLFFSRFLFELHMSDMSN